MENLQRGVSQMNLEGNVYENWLFFKQRFLNYLKATDMVSKSQIVQCAQLLHLIGDDAFRIYNTFKFSDEEKDKLQPLLDKFEEYFKPRSNLAHERYTFFSRKQFPEETIDAYITFLQNKSKNCQFINLEDSLIKTCLTCGVRNDNIRQRLLENDNMSLDEAIKLCKAVKSSKIQSQSMATNSTEVNVVKKKFTSKKWNKEKTCKKCGDNHDLKATCKAAKAKCNICKKYGHFAKVCFYKKSIKSVEKTSDDESTEDSENFCISEIKSNKENDDWQIQMKINNCEKIWFKIDTGAMTNVINSETMKLLKIEKNSLIKDNCRLTSYSNEKIPILGKCNLKCEYKNKQYQLTFYVTSAKSPNIIGLKTSNKLNLIKKMFSIDNNKVIEKFDYDEIKTKFKDVFTGIGCIGKPHHIELKQDAQPVQHPPRKIPLALKKELKQTLDDLEKKEIIRKVDEPTDWINSMVMVRKSNGSIRLCIDPRDLNEYIKRENFQLPTTEDIASDLTGNKYFSKLDASNGFHQIPLDESSSKLCTFSCIYGRYRYLRMPYGIKSASEIFHKRFQNIFNVPGTRTYIDDLIVFGSSKREHDQRLLQVLEIARKNNVKFNHSKCQFGVNRIKYLGFIFDEFGQTVDPDKVKAIINMKRPENKKDIQRLLGMVTYLSKHVPNLSSITSPLRELLRKDTSWHWHQTHESSFEKLKTIINNACTLKHFNTKETSTITVDCSKDAIGMALLQKDQPCAYASKALTQTQCNYSQIEKELLGILVACEKFHNYIYPVHFHVETDHKPLISIIKKPLINTPPRLQRMLLKLRKYNFTLSYKKGKELYIADTLSRSCTDSVQNKDSLDQELEDQICLADLSYKISKEKLISIRDETKNDYTLKKVIEYIKNGWPQQTSDELKPYFKIRNEITEVNNLLLRNNRIIIPTNLRKEILTKLHYAHLGIQKCKNLARQYLYWPGMNKDVETMINNCKTCAYFIVNRKEPLKCHDVPTRPWQKVGSDIFQIDSTYYLLLIDYYSKYVEIVALNNNLTSRNVISHVKSIFARHGIPDTFISDGGKQYDSEEFKQFAKEWEFDLINTSPENSKSNGLAERSIQTVKRLFKKAYYDKRDPYLSLLFYRTTPLSDDLPSPSELLMSRKLKTIIPTTDKNLNPKINNTIAVKNKLKQKQTTQKKYYDRATRKLSELPDKAKVFVKYRNKIQEGEIDTQIRERTYKVKLDDDRVINRNRIFLTPIPSGIVASKTDSKEKDEEEIADLNEFFKEPINVNKNCQPNQAMSSSGRKIKKPDRLNL